MGKYIDVELERSSIVTFLKKSNIKKLLKQTGCGQSPHPSFGGSVQSKIKICDDVLLKINIKTILIFE